MVGEASHAYAVAAKHNYKNDKPFVHTFLKDNRAQSRGRYSNEPHVMCDPSGHDDLGNAARGQACGTRSVGE